LAGAQNLPDARVAGTVNARGRLGHPEALHVDVPSFSATSGASDLQGKLALDNLERPHITVDARSRFLDVDDFLPASGGKGKPSASEKPGPLDRADGRVRLEVARGRAAGIAYDDLHADLALDQGVLRAQTLEVATLGGHISAAGSAVPLRTKDRP